MLPELRWFLAGKTWKRPYLVSACGRFCLTGCKMHEGGCCLLLHKPDEGRQVLIHFGDRDEAMHWARRKAAN